ncbi:DNA-binding protein [Lipomyces tetrasporus]|uniref:DNA-binding protein n=1 Tax=Lipomyces tetrasporus TaxID=54092 RepID=A0AAD7QWW8_9ASCO|nr:DNA-binding protein [Lipomyces tetrasporus]KAJ8102828.1 DNA-binding protein [Lipomyces tetrasporus]
MPASAKPPAQTTASSVAPTRSKLSLKGSSKVVAEFFEYSINSILFQRGIYPPEDFQVVKKYGLNMLITVDEEVKSYIRRIMSQLNKWIIGGKISKLVVAVVALDTGDVAERWQFDIEVFSKSGGLAKTSASVAGKENAVPESGMPTKEKSVDEIQSEIQAIIRQITASVTFLPVLEGRHTFNVLVYADGDAQVPAEWIDSDPKEVRDAEQVKLRSFSTNSHKVDTMVAYRLGTAE